MSSNLIQCEKCDHKMEVGDYPFCPHSPSSTSMISSDDIPGGLEVRHGICNPDGTPRKYYSKTEIKRAAYEAGYTILGETPKPNSRIQEKEHRDREAKGN